MATQTFIPGTNIPVNAPVPVNPQQPPMAAKDGHVMSDDEIRAYKEKWEQDNIETDKLIENAVKLASLWGKFKLALYRAFWGMLSLFCYPKAVLKTRVNL